MARISATNVLTVATCLTGIAVSAAFLADDRRLTGIALGGTVVLGALLVRSVARDLGSATHRQARRTDVLRRQLIRAMRSQSNAMEAEVARMTRRVLGDINADRLERLDERENTESS